MILTLTVFRIAKIFSINKEKVYEKNDRKTKIIL